MAKKTFEESLARLEDITRQLEEGEISLDESLKIFDEGVKLARICQEKLESAQAKVDLLLKKDGTFTRVPFEQKDSGKGDDGGE